MRIGIIGPTEKEINPFIKSMSGIETEEYAMLSIYKGKYRDLDVVALSCGICKVNAAIAAQILIDRYEAGRIIVTGVAGAIDERLKLLDSVISTEVAYHDVAEMLLTEYHPKMGSVYFRADGALQKGLAGANAGDETVLSGRMVTGEAFIDKSGREEIIEKYSPLCVDMETAGIAHVCYVNSVPFAAIRSMSDTPQESGFEVFEKYCSLAAEKSVKVLKRYLDSI